MKKPKNIHLTEGAIKALSIMAIENGTNFKNYVESLLEAWAGEKKKKKEGQNIQRVEILAYLDANYIQVPVDAIIVNDDLVAFDFRGWDATDFNDLETDTKEALRFLGYKIWAVDRDPLKFTYFAKNNKTL